ncbi:hypothetical protein VQ042_18860 [Aurantimonas sp. A2-1-M11]|uniref:hypothetical protein n=1 Tax=Aurantimonas sp. A2-1-M11 TaxID=3113712 RepID=UPI002F9550E8
MKAPYRRRRVGHGRIEGKLVVLLADRGDTLDIPQAFLDGRHLAAAIEMANDGGADMTKHFDAGDVPGIGRPVAVGDRDPRAPHVRGAPGELRHDPVARIDIRSALEDDDKVPRRFGPHGLEDGIDFQQIGSMRHGTLAPP